MIENEEPDLKQLKITNELKCDGSLPISYITIPNFKNDYLRICLVQLDFEVNDQFPYQLKDKNNIETKIKHSLEIARKENVDAICFPELSFTKNLIFYIKENFKNSPMIIIGGAFIIIILINAL